MTDPVTLLLGDCVERMKELPDCSVDAVVTDPPYDLTAASRNGSPRNNDLAIPSGLVHVNIQRLFAFPSVARKGFMSKTWDGTGVAFKPEEWRILCRLRRC